MKIRTGFVSNSSSSSFVINKNYLSAEQIVLIKNHSEEGLKFDIPWAEDAWFIEETENYIKGNTFMDNFDMRRFLERIGVDMDCVEWDERD